MYLKVNSEISKSGPGRECDWLQNERNVVSKGDNLSLLLLGFFYLRWPKREGLNLSVSHFPRRGVAGIDLKCGK